MKLTICYYTSRDNPLIDWFFDSLRHQETLEDDIDIVVVDVFAEDQARRNSFNAAAKGRGFKHVLPKPNVWQGKHRLTKENWWAISNARNTGVCYAKDGWISWVDDRSVLLPSWLPALRQAMKTGYCVAGAYEKRKDMAVEDGIIKDMGELTGADPRTGYVDGPVLAPGSWWFGGTSALPVEAVLSVNGVDETCDSLGLEDNLFGMMLTNSGYCVKYDTRMKLVEDRTPGPSQGSSVFKRADKGISPNDKSHALLYKLKDLKKAIHDFDLRDVRNRILSGGDFPIPTTPTHDWYDGQPLSEF
jgi:hypothetical protein